VVVALAAGIGIFSKDAFVNETVLGGSKLPEKMLAIVTTKPGEIEIKEVPVPKPKYGEMLVKVGFAAVNPSDIYHALGDYRMPGTETTFPHTNGFEGSGSVVASGGGPLTHAYAYLGLRCAVAGYGGKGTVWAEFTRADPMATLPLPSSVDLKHGSMSFANPLTVISFFEVLKAGNHKAMVHTAATSALGIQLLRLAKVQNVDIVAVVRGEKNMKILKDRGHPEELSVQSDTDTFENDLRNAVEKTGATLAFDAVNGPMAAQIYEALPAKAELFLYGFLSGEEPPQYIKEKEKDKTKPVKFHHLKIWLEEGGILRLGKSLIELYKYLPNELRTEVDQVLDARDKKTTLEKLQAYKKHQKGGKMVLKFAGE